MDTVTSFHASAVQVDQLNGITAEYLALERARILRRLLVKRFAILAAIFTGVGVMWLSAFALWFSVGLCVIAPAWAWMFERGCERRLARRLDQLPGGAAEWSSQPPSESHLKKS